MKRALLFVLLLMLWQHIPWTLLAVTGEAMVLSPGLTRLSSTGTDQYWLARALETRLADLGWSVDYQSNLIANGRRAYGVSDIETHQIVVDRDLSWNARYSVLAHEGGHTLAAGWYGYEQREIFAECVATLMSHDGVREHARYLSGFKTELIMMVLTEWPKMYRAAALLEDNQ